MIIKNDGAWVLTTDDVFINLDYVDYIEYVTDNVNLNDECILYVGKESYTAYNWGPHGRLGDTKTEHEIIKDFRKKAYGIGIGLVRGVITIGNCAWTTISDFRRDYLININRIDRVDFITTYYSSKKDSCIRLDMLGKKFLFNRDEQKVFLSYFNLPQKGLPSGFVWPQPGMKRFKRKVVESRWKRTLHELLGNGIYLKSSVPSEERLMESSFDSLWKAKEFQKGHVEAFSRDGGRKYQKDELEYYFDRYSSLILTNADEFQDMATTQKEAADILTQIHSDFSIPVCIEGSDLEKRTPILWECIQNYNETLANRTEARKQRNKNIRND